MHQESTTESPSSPPAHDTGHPLHPDLNTGSRAQPLAAADDDSGYARFSAATQRRTASPTEMSNSNQAPSRPVYAPPSGPPPGHLSSIQGSPPGGETIQANTGSENIEPIRIPRRATTYHGETRERRPPPDRQLPPTPPDLTNMLANVPVVQALGQEHTLPDQSPGNEGPKPEAAFGTVAYRLEPTLENAKNMRIVYDKKAKLTGYALNTAIGLQVVLGSLTTGLSVVTTGHQTQIMTAILGGLATIVASYLARARGSGEPDLSIARLKDLEQFIRECEAFIHDHRTNIGRDEDIITYRRRFEELLGNSNGERRLASSLAAV